MDDQYEEQDDLLSSFPAVPKFPNSDDALHSHTNPFALSSDSHAEETHAPKIFDRFDGSSSDEDEFSISAVSNFPQNGVVKTAGRKLDYMIQFLDRKLSKANSSPNNSENRPLPEFIGNGGGTGMFRVPVRAAVRPDRPPSLEVRPRPLRETQIGCCLRTILCSESQLWAGGECGVRFWNFSELYSAGQAEVETARVADEMSAPFLDSAYVPEVSCMIADEGERVVWSGHTDGKIRCWRMDQILGGNGFNERLSWQAHKGPVLSMTMTSYGDLWSATENGVIKIWPWEAIEKALYMIVEERHMAALVVERSYIDLRSQATTNGACYTFASDVKYLVSDHSTAKVWSAGLFSFALWDARTRELLKVFNVDGQAENWVDMPAIQDMTVEDEIKTKFVAALKKDKPQASLNFLQRSRNVILGAADAVRRAAAKGAFGVDNRTEAMVMTMDGKIWTGCTSGLLVQWDGNGNRLQDFQYHSCAVQCLCTFGSQMWVGYVSGTVQVLDLNGNLLGGWVAHCAPVIKMAVGSSFVFTLASHGGIRGWNLTSPGPLDSLLRSELSGKEFLYTRLENLKILAGTWNVGEGRASRDSLISWLGSAASDVDLVVVGLQELEMGAGVLAMSAAKETVGLEGSAVGQWWLDMIGSILDEGSTFERIGSRQLAGMLISVWVRNNLKGHIGDVDAAAVACGFGHAIGNKGAVGLRMRVYDRIICFVNCHFAAHLEAVNRRNADFDHVYRTMTFTRPSNLLNAAAAGITSAVQMLHGTNAVGVRSGELIPELSEADMVVFLGDFNYRIDGISYDEARDFISQRSFDWLRERDQLHAEMEAGKVFPGMREAIIGFPPTYKFERHQPGLAGYDAGEKRRVPAWCDRVLYRDSRSSAASECSLDCPVVGSITQYDACMDVTDSDHKPVRCLFNVDIACVDESVRRQEFGEIIESNEQIRCMLEELCKVPETFVSSNNIILQNNITLILRITNKSRRDRALYKIVCEGELTIKEDGLASDHCRRGSFGLPRWLEVNPATGIIEPDHTAEISVHHDDFHTREEFVDGLPRNSWCEDARDREVILAVNIGGSFTTETSSHRIKVRHCFSAKTKHLSPKSDGSDKSQRNLLHRSSIHQLDQFDAFDQLRNLRSP
ncbi:hypothetical protein Nepgr_013264 [Nepenthes gracilis]|uniref:Inositol polyphosphate-related phosphatase domain-containing protein n=1 Tax=Nepenthes gracilis TaxID=150966 RepID=A0AAD3SHG8_NEPGR|nr:hypothetical protein Nepgr_013264 [Nepenthes gracilis]